MPFEAFSYSIKLYKTCKALSHTPCSMNPSFSSLPCSMRLSLHCSYSSLVLCPLVSPNLATTFLGTQGKQASSNILPHSPKGFHYLVQCIPTILSILPAVPYKGSHRFLDCSSYNGKLDDLHKSCDGIHGVLHSLAPSRVFCFGVFCLPLLEQTSIVRKSNLLEGSCAGLSHKAAHAHA